MRNRLEDKLKQIDGAFNQFIMESGKLEGQKDILLKQIGSSAVNIEQKETLRRLDERSIEVLNLVQRSTRDKVKEAFENMVTFALHSIYQEDYKFQLEFNTRGNLGEMDFKLKSPANKEYLDLKDCTAGGSYDIISLALRFVLIQTIRPKAEGFIFLDEPAKMLRGENLKQNLFNFFNQMSIKLNRQLIIIPPVDDAAFFIQQAETKIKVG